VAIQLVPYNRIDFSKWDNCITHAVNGIVYGYSWYLDITAEHWDALVEDDYNSVFPLVFGKKLGMNHLYQPFLTQQLGIFSKSTLDPIKVKEFIDLIPPKFKFIRTNFNTYNNITSQQHSISNRVTFQLDLIQPYHKISSNYSDNTRRNISRSHALGVNVVRGLAVDDLILLKRENSSTSLKEKHYIMMKRIATNAISKGIGEIYAAYSSDNSLCAASFFIKSNGKLVYLIAASNEQGKENRAMFRLVDHYINANSETNQILDFEGSSIDSIARFYSGFGAVPCTYQQLVVNKLPFFLKPLFK